MSDEFHCQICGRLLNQESDPLSLDCGGDCLGCMREIEGNDLPYIADDQIITLWFCIRCHHTGHVVMPKHEDVLIGAHRVWDNHSLESPDCRERFYIHVVLVPNDVLAKMR